MVAHGRYRYRLWRRWLPGAATVVWVMLNPSTADDLREQARFEAIIARVKADLAARFGELGGVEFLLKKDAEHGTFTARAASGLHGVRRETVIDFDSTPPIATTRLSALNATEVFVRPIVPADIVPRTSVIIAPISAMLGI